jgi:hypothetical protein
MERAMFVIVKSRFWLQVLVAFLWKAVWAREGESWAKFELHWTGGIDELNGWGGGGTLSCWSRW